jgi:hypothetical protein
MFESELKNTDQNRKDADAFGKLETAEDFLAFLNFYANSGRRVNADDLIVAMNLIQLRHGDLDYEKKIAIKNACIIGFNAQKNQNSHDALEYLKIIENLRDISLIDVQDEIRVSIERIRENLQRREKAALFMLHVRQM